jgi:hypothetical protein
MGSEAFNFQVMRSEAFKSPMIHWIVITHYWLTFSEVGLFYLDVV